MVANNTDRYTTNWEGETDLVVGVGEDHIGERVGIIFMNSTKNSTHNGGSKYSILKNNASNKISGYRGTLGFNKGYELPNYIPGKISNNWNAHGIWWNNQNDLDTTNDNINYTVDQHLQDPENFDFRPKKHGEFHNNGTTDNTALTLNYDDWNSSDSLLNGLNLSLNDKDGNPLFDFDNSDLDTLNPLAPNNANAHVLSFIGNSDIGAYEYDDNLLPIIP